MFLHFSFYEHFHRKLNAINFKFLPRVALQVLVAQETFWKFLQAVVLANRETTNTAAHYHISMPIKSQFLATIGKQTTLRLIWKHCVSFFKKHKSINDCLPFFHAIILQQQSILKDFRKNILRKLLCCVIDNVSHFHLKCKVRIQSQSIHDVYK